MCASENALKQGPLPEGTGNSTLFLKQEIPIRRRRLYLEQDGLCFYCLRPMGFFKLGNDPNGSRVTIDHLTPLSLGGRYGYLNEVAACHRCNNRRGTMCWLTFYCVAEIEREA